MSESIAIMILGNATANGSSQTALEFARAVIANGKRIERLFFYHEAVVLGSNLTIWGQDEQNLPDNWQTFIKDNNLDAVVCIASALKRGIINSSEASRYEKPASNLGKGLELSGLGQWVDAVSKADKYIVFGA